MGTRLRVVCSSISDWWPPPLPPPKKRCNNIVLPPTTTAVATGPRRVKQCVRVCTVAIFRRRVQQQPTPATATDSCRRRPRQLLRCPSSPCLEIGSVDFPSLSTHLCFRDKPLSHLLPCRVPGQ